MERKKVLLMYSGGLDSILSMARLVSQGYKVLLVHFDNGCSISTGLEVERAMKFENRYGKDIVEYVGKLTTVPLFRNNEREIANMSFSELCSRYGDTTISQVRCLNCRSAMYHEAIRYCLLNDVHFIAEGARKSQLFSIEQPKVIEGYRQLLNEFGIELLLPVYDLEDDWEKENELLAHDIFPEASEDKCVLGMPLDEPVPEHQTDAISRMLEENIKPRYVKELKLIPNNPQYLYKGKGKLEFD